VAFPGVDGEIFRVVTRVATALIIGTHVVINVDGQNNTKDVDLIMLSFFAHRFMAIAEQLGRALQKTRISTNVKERLNCSHALLDSTGTLVANAPQLPVHLGSMSTCIGNKQIYERAI